MIENRGELRRPARCPMIVVGSILFVLLAAVAASVPAETARPPLLAAEGRKEGTVSSRGEKAAEPKAVEPKEKRPPTAALPVYRPPWRGAPGGRIGGGTRGLAAQWIQMAALAPDHIALTVQEQPSLFWYINQATEVPAVFTFIDKESTRPIVEVRLPEAIEAGIHRVRVSDFDLHLMLGVQYEWFVSLVRDPDRRSKDVIAGAVIERVQPSEALKVERAAAKVDLTYRYAEAGIWYDALETISDLIEMAPADETLRRQRASLLEQVGLPEVAAYDLKSPRGESR